MIHLSKGKNKKFYISVEGKNGRQLSVTESNGINTRRSAFKNLQAQASAFDSPGMLVQDNTGKKPVIYFVYPQTSLITPMKLPSAKTKRPYIPGK